MMHLFNCLMRVTWKDGTQSDFPDTLVAAESSQDVIDLAGEVMVKRYNQQTEQVQKVEFFGIGLARVMDSKGYASRGRIEVVLGEPR